jgi:GNAT superfamily N-acetyltransferase
VPRVTGSWASSRTSRNTRSPSPASGSGTCSCGGGSFTSTISRLPEARRRGYGRRLLEWLGEEAERLGCEQFHLDSGVGPTRTDAHRLYFNTGLEITSFHFARDV